MSAKFHTNAIAQLRKRIKAEKSPKGIKIGSVGHAYDVTELQFRNGSRPYYRDPYSGAIRSVRRDKIRAERKANAWVNRKAAR